MQRLNVGFSRAKEKIVFICSKNIHEYSSSLKTALNHYQNKLESASILPNLSDVDPNSEQEKKVVHWLRQSKLIEKYSKRIEVIAQYPIGEYIKSLIRAMTILNTKLIFCYFIMTLKVSLIKLLLNMMVLNIILIKI